MAREQLLEMTCKEASVAELKVLVMSGETDRYHNEPNYAYASLLLEI
jgi:hypothetical protein